MKKRYVIFLWICAITLNPFQSLHSETHEEAPFLILHADNGAGMFAMFSVVLGCLNLYEQGVFAGLQVDFDSGLYLDPARGANWWEYYFEPIYGGDERALKQNLSLPEIYLRSGKSGLGFALSRKKAFKLIQKYIFIKPHIQKKIDLFVKKNFKKHFVIGVHHRGTDKKLEASLVSYEKTYQALRQVIKRLPSHHRYNYRIYIATDDQKFLDYLVNLFPSKRLIYPQFVRSVNDEPLHYNDHFYSSNYQKGKEALFDCLLLSKCDYLIYPKASSLSIMSTFFNPFMPITPLIGDSLQ